MGFEECDEIVQSLLSRVENFICKDGNNLTVIPDVFLYRQSKPMERSFFLSEPLVTVVLQGRVSLLLGHDELICDRGNYVLSTVRGLPVLARVDDISPGYPYTVFGFKLDLQMIRQVLIDHDVAFPLLKKASSGRGMTVGKTTVDLLHALQRLLSLLDRPEDIPALYGGIKYEIIYRLLTSEEGERLREIAIAGTRGNRIAKVVEWIHKHYREPLKVEELASESGMGVSTLYHHFHEITAMSPLQYQKMLRLTEARRLMLEENCDAGGAAFQVGYESQSQFSREYRRLFGTPPLRDIKALLKR
ncbi:MAG: AraC family transcriptional regulator [Deltaproteobacteria bacterium]|nr:AraC family transcriptional regulator [Deltaproteobacteria bacterium]